MHDQSTRKHFTDKKHMKNGITNDNCVNKALANILHITNTWGMGWQKMHDQNTHTQITHNKHMKIGITKDKCMNKTHTNI